MLMSLLDYFNHVRAANENNHGKLAFPFTWDIMVINFSRRNYIKLASDTGPVAGIYGLQFDHC